MSSQVVCNILNLYILETTKWVLWANSEAPGEMQHDAAFH